MLSSDSQRFIAAVDASGRVTDLRSSVVVDELVRMLQSSGERIVRGRMSRQRLRVYSGSSHNPRICGRFSMSHELRTRFIREHPMTLAPDSKAASETRWLSILDAVINCQHVPADETEAATWALDHLELDLTPGSYLIRSEVLDAFLKAHPGPVRHRGRELMQALRDVDMMQPGPSGRVISDPALWVNGEKVRVLFGLRWVKAEAETAPAPSSPEPNFKFFQR